MCCNREVTAKRKINTKARRATYNALALHLTSEMRYKTAGKESKNAKRKKNVQGMKLIPILTAIQPDVLNQNEEISDLTKHDNILSTNFI